MLFLELGIIILFGFLGAALAERYGQTAVISYIVVGIIIGPYQLGKVLGFIKPEDIEEGGFIYFISQIGLILLLFFIGLDLSFSRLRRVRLPIIILATVDMGLNIFVGFAIGMYFGWPFADTVFLACIISMSSVAIAIKLIEEMKWEDRIETEVLVGLMIIEDLAAIILLTVVCGFTISPETGIQNIGLTLIGIMVLFGFFIIFAFVFIPAFSKKMERIKNEEIFILLALGLVFLSAALAEVFKIAPMIGAFMIGMAFADTPLASKLKTKLMSFKNAFVAIFFISFGMMINTQLFSIVAELVTIAVILVVINEVIIVAAIAYLIGFSSRASVCIGAGTMARSEEAIIFANVGYGLKSAKTQAPILANREQLYPFSGMFCLVLSILTALFMRYSYRIADFFALKMPKFVCVTGKIHSRTFKTLMIPHALIIPYYKDKKFSYAVVVYFVVLAVLILSGGDWGSNFYGYLMEITRYAGYICGVVILVALWFIISDKVEIIVNSTNYPGISSVHVHRKIVKNFTTITLQSAFIFVFAATVVWRYCWQVSVCVILAYVPFFLIVMYLTYLNMIRQPQLIRRRPKIHYHREERFTYRRRWR